MIYLASLCPPEQSEGTQIIITIMVTMEILRYAQSDKDSKMTNNYNNDNPTTMTTL